MKPFIFIITIIIFSYITVGVIMVRRNTNYKPVFVSPRDYQIHLSMDSIHLYDGTRYIGSVKHSDNPLDSLLAVDNQ